MKLRISRTLRSCTSTLLWRKRCGYSRPVVYSKVIAKAARIAITSSATIAEQSSWKCCLEGTSMETRFRPHFPQRHFSADIIFGNDVSVILHGFSRIFSEIKLIEFRIVEELELTSSTIFTSLQNFSFRDRLRSRNFFSFIELCCLLILGYVIDGAFLRATNVRLRGLSWIELHFRNPLTSWHIENFDLFHRVYSWFSRFRKSARCVIFPALK